MEAFAVCDFRRFPAVEISTRFNNNRKQMCDFLREVKESTD